MVQNTAGDGSTSGQRSTFLSTCWIALAVILLGVGLPQDAAAQFVDTFDRPDAANVGNGWIEKSPAAFQIDAGTAEKAAVSSDYRNNIVYRPAAEDLLDSEASVEFRLTNASPGYPQIFTRVQSNTVGFTNFLDGYILYVDDNPTRAVVGRQTGSSFLSSLATLTITPGLNTTDNYRMRLRTTGTDPVQVSAWVERWNGTGWDIIGQATANDTAGARIQTAGSAGFGGYIESSYRYDNFTITDLGGGSNPIPALAAISPNNVVEGSSAFSLTVTGSDFIPGSVVRWNGTDRQTTFVSSTELQAAITTADVAAAGTASVTVFTPTPGGGTSAAQTFTIDSAPADNPLPVLTTISPNSAVEGSSAFSLTVTGSDFVPGSVVRWNGGDRQTTYVSPTELQAAITAADVAAAGTASVTVFTPAPGGGTSATQTFTIDNAPADNPLPVLAAISPNNVVEGSSAFSLTVTGSDFIPGSVVRWNGTDRQTTYVSPTELQAAITAADVAAAGTAAVTVFTPAPGGGTSAAQTFTIDSAPAGNPLPVLTAISPNTIGEGSSAFSLTVTGSDFIPGSVVRWNGADRQTTYVSSTELQAAITTADVATAGSASVTAFTPTPGGGTSASLPFTIQSVSTQFIDTFDRPDAAAVGNGWIEKSPAAFRIDAGTAEKVAVSSDYRNNIVYRPAAEDLLDSEASMEFRLTNASPGYPQIFTRVQSNTVGFTGSLDGYILYVDDNPTRAVVGRQRGSSFLSSLATLTLTPGLNTTDNYRMRLRTTGTNPVQVSAWVERWNGTGWDIIGQATAQDTAGTRIQTAGAAGFGGYIESNYRFDNFTITDLGSGSNPVPALASISPNSVVEGSSAFSLTVTGSDFIPGSVVRWNGADRQTTYVSSTELQAVITTADVATAGTASVTVFTPAPGGGTSAVQAFTIDNAAGDNPLPVLTAINPNTVAEGSSAFALTVTGTNFIPGSVVRWNGGDRQTTYVSPNELQAAITAADVATAGTAAVTVFTPAPGGGTSATQTFTITGAPADNPLPVLAAISPNSAVEGSSAFSLTVTGSDFVPGSVVRWNGGDRQTTYVSPNELQAAITAADVATPGTASVTVFTLAPGGGTSATQTFTIDPLNPGTQDAVITSLSPESTVAGSGAVTVTVIGENFTNQTVAYWDGQPRSTTFVSAQQIEIDLSANDVALPGVFTVTADSTGAGAGLSAPHPFFALDTNGSYFFDNFNTSDSPTIGNGWTEKNPGAFSLEGNAVTSVYTSQVYRDNIVYRPGAEDRQDVEVAAEFVRQQESRYTQLHARAQRPGVTTPDLLESYIFYVEDNPSLPPSVAFAIGPDLASTGECIIDVVGLPGPLQVGERYRMTFRVTGENPVELDGRIEWFTGGVWQSIFSATVYHGDSTPPDPFYCDPGYMPPRITESGATGFSKWRDQTDSYDNYYWLDLSTAAAAPEITSISPNTVTEGSSGITLTVDGSNFVPNSVVRWNGSPRPTTYVSGTMLQASIPASDLTSDGTVSITVTTPPPGGGASNAVDFQILAEGQQVNPVPSIQNLSPSTAVAGSPAFQLTVTGSDFVVGSVVRWNGSDRTTVYISETTLQATINASDIAAAGDAFVTVFSPQPGGGESTPASFTVSAGDLFFDDFGRPDSADPLNGWIEKTPATFSIAQGTLQKENVSSGYLQNVIYRPAAESRLDVETSVELNLNGGTPGYPQIFARLQPDTVATPNALDGYLLYVDNSLNRAVVGRQRGSLLTQLASFPLGELLNAQNTYRLRLSVTGTNSVSVIGYVERQTQTGYVVIGQANVLDNSGLRVSTPGVSGLGGHNTAIYRFDNFRDQNN